ncbi:MAG: galactose-1-phosphate uridylyltransferase [Gemmatimonadales bacterium]|nr:galactose-1-phosphate uridylyltransferase [Gemmatimonadales bacterium]NIN10603.1 galactose-1-phosphate uridylyltransferase [Gemmatimonadales bacterium]NIN49365.1 galactose-1-phosphate uridylyltransferase [Gemmatimonadales bacterium]NIP06829.1 galactose-1-phosphate uridylyltransferase [Gemmatimonadales bacterium]NIR01503.1 galactose-1-phosphate uridylyltransferase [Gemmatimonadales bacterium]
MPEFRRDATTGEWVILAAERAKRPGGRSKRRSRREEVDFAPDCPFCPGNEGQTPPEILRRPAQGNWLVRVVPNKYPALIPDLPAEEPSGGELHEHLPARGHYEVIIEGRAHRSRLAPAEPAVLQEVFLAARERYRAFGTEPDLAFVSLFKNHGPGAGASLPHPHWQLAVTPVVPGDLERMLHIARSYWQRRQSSVYGDLLERELAAGTRIVEVGQRFVAFAPYAPRWAGETWIVPREEWASFAETDDDGVTQFAELLHDTLTRLAGGLDEPDCNVTIFSAPLNAPDVAGFRWHGRIQPRLTVRGGFELGSGIAITILAPEQTAELLRNAAAD